MVCRGSRSSALPVVAFAVAAVAAAGPDGCRRPVGRTVLIRPAAGCCLPRRAPTRRCRLGIWATPVASAGGAAAPRPGEGEGDAGGGGGEEDGDSADADADTDSASSPDAGAAAAASDDSEGASSVPLDVADAADGADREGPVAIEYLREGVNDEADSGDGDLIRLPLFPLSMVLHPGTEAVPLHIFEMKFRLLFNRISDGDKRFGIVMYDKDAGTLARYGCVAEMTRMDNLPDGRMMTLSDGVQRFRILKLVDSDRDEPGAGATPYLVGLVRLISDETATAAPSTPADKAPPPSASPEARAAETPDDLVKAAAAADAGDATPADAAAAVPGPPLTSLGMWQLERNVWVALQDVLRLSNKLYDRTLELNAGLLDVAPPNAPTDAGLLDAGTSLPANLRSGVGSSGDNTEEDDARDGSTESVPAARKRSEAFSFAVAAILDQPLREQQRLLQTTDTGVRLRSLLRLLDAARRYLAAQSQIKDALS
ncbi:hypothetical protein I4F81_003526 [Pyropia yezoensis]|uniref:Uncharacterized protein n=1 Tax=Pyropia yezoensis TaxID=2788 RepID=A0ACC3BSG0_PYRYE|nr:hypothetical protein I4F81_003526 [Neopyropia yezoensis]